MAIHRVHSFIQAISMDTVSKFHAEAPQATASEGLAQRPMWRRKLDSNPHPFRWNATNLRRSHHAHYYAE